VDATDATDPEFCLGVWTLITHTVAAPSVLIDEMQLQPMFTVCKIIDTNIMLSSSQVRFSVMTANYNIQFATLRSIQPIQDASLSRVTTFNAWIAEPIRQ